MRVLIAEDDDRLARAVAAGLRRRGMTVDVALDGGDALDRLAVSRYDVVVLDRDLPGVHGDDICRTLVAGRSATGWRGWGWAPMTTCPSRSTSPSWSPAYRRWPGGRAPPPPRAWATA